MTDYYESQRRRRKIKGRGFFDSLIGAVTSQAAKEVVSQAAKKIATNALSDVGNRATKKFIDKIIPPSKGKGLTNKSKEILSKDTGAIPIEKYVKRNV